MNAGGGGEGVKAPEVNRPVGLEFDKGFGQSGC
jgi:hypothetical protein